MDPELTPWLSKVRVSFTKLVIVSFRPVQLSSTHSVSCSMVSSKSPTSVLFSLSVEDTSKFVKESKTFFFCNCLVFLRVWSVIGTNSMSIISAPAGTNGSNASIRTCLETLIGSVKLDGTVNELRPMEVSMVTRSVG